MSSKPPSEEGFLKNSVMTGSSFNPGAKLFHDFQYIYYAGVSHHVMHPRMGKPSGVSGGAGALMTAPGVEEEQAACRGATADPIDDSGTTHPSYLMYMREEERARAAMPQERVVRPPHRECSAAA